MMDMMGRGSVIGTNNVLVKEEWCYKAIARSSESTAVIQIPKYIIENLKNQADKFKTRVTETEEHIE